MYSSLSPTKHFFALSGSPVNYSLLNLDTPGHQAPSVTSKGDAQNCQPVCLPALMSVCSCFLGQLLHPGSAHSGNTWDSAALLRLENGTKIGLLRCPGWIARCSESPLESRAPCFVLFVCILGHFSKANDNYK